MKSYLLVLLTINSFILNAQEQKIGHADWQYIFNKLPEYKQIETEIRTYEDQLKNQLKLKTQELETKYKIYQGLPPDTPETIKKDRESELAYLQENLQKFKQDAQLSIQKKENDLITPVYEKVGKAIEAVAAENGFSYILNLEMVSGGQTLLFADNKYNISGLVLKKLGIDINR
jgi:outer membrane protein